MWHWIWICIQNMDPGPDSVEQNQCGSVSGSDTLVYMLNSLKYNNVVCRYTWPLTVGRGSMRGAEDEHDQVSALTILSLLRNFFLRVCFLKGTRTVPTKKRLVFYF